MAAVKKQASMNGGNSGADSEMGDDNEQLNANKSA